MFNTEIRVQLITSDNRFVDDYVNIFKSIVFSQFMTQYSTNQITDQSMTGQHSSNHIC